MDYSFQLATFFYMHHPTDRITHTMAFVTPVMEHWLEGRKEKEMFYLTMHSTHFIYGFVESDIWLRTILIVRKETRCRHIGYSFWLTARVFLYAPSHRQDSTYHGLSYTSRGALAWHWLEQELTQWVHHEGSIQWPIAPWANAFPTELHFAPREWMKMIV